MLILSHQVFTVYIINFLKTIIVFGSVLYSFVN
jgi:hypothetical protein